MRDIVSPLDGFRSPFGARRGFSPASLFASGEEGAWYEPSTTTCFTDTGGTTPATYGDGVAYLQDLSGNGNHATQVTAGARPILARVPEGGRRNLLEYTEDLTNAVWVKSPNITAPTVNRIEENTTSSTVFPITQTITSAPAGSYTFTVDAKQSERQYVAVNINVNSFAGRYSAYVDLSDGSFVTGDSTGTVAGASYAISGPDADGYYTISVTLTNHTSGNVDARVAIGKDASPTFANSLPVYTGTVGSGLLVRKAQLELGSTATAYQKVVDEYDITEAGVTSLDYLSFDGVDDVLLVSSANLNTALNGGDSSMMAGFSSDCQMQFVNSSAEDIHLGIQSLAGTGLRAIYRNTTFRASSTSYVTPSVLHGFFDASAKTAALRANGVDQSESAASDNTITNGDFVSIGGLYRLTPTYSEGGFYGSVVLDRALTTAEIDSTETYLANRSGVTL